MSNPCKNSKVGPSALLLRVAKRRPRTSQVMSVTRYFPNSTCNNISNDIDELNHDTERKLIDNSRR